MFTIISWLKNKFKKKRCQRQLPTNCIVVIKFKIEKWLALIRVALSTSVESALYVL